MPAPFGHAADTAPPQRRNDWSRRLAVAAAAGPVGIVVLAGCGSGSSSDGEALPPEAAVDALLTAEDITAGIPGMADLHQEFRGLVDPEQTDSEGQAAFMSEDAECQEYFEETAASPRVSDATLVADNHDTGLLLTQDIYVTDVDGIMTDAETAQGCPEYSIGAPVNATVSTSALDLSADGWDVVADAADVQPESLPPSSSATAFASNGAVVIAVSVNGGDAPVEQVAPLLELAIQKYEGDLPEA
jgi:hypothetical protein